MSDEAKVQPAADFHDSPIKRASHALLEAMLRESIFKRLLRDEPKDTKPADLRAAANAPWPSGSKLTRDLGAIQTIPMQGLTMAQVREAVDQMKATNAMVDQVCGLPRAGLSRALRERAERAIGMVTATNFTRAAPDEAIVTHLCEIAERLGLSDVAQLDQENARLRRELADAKMSEEHWRSEALRYAGNVDYWRERAEGKPADGVIKVEPFPEPAPRSESWPPPSHKPRVLP